MLRCTAAASVVVAVDEVDIVAAEGGSDGLSDADLLEQQEPKQKTAV